MRLLRYLLICAGIVFILYGCSKPGDNPSPAPPVPPTPPVFTVDNKWECTVDGVNFSGTIDTSFVEFISSGSATLQDTILDCNGTSSDKKANIHFRIGINRTATSFRDISTVVNAWLSFDTLSKKFLKTSAFNQNAVVVFHIDTIAGNKYRGTFKGALLADDGLGAKHTITDGKFNFELGKGNNEPKSFSFNVDATGFAGFFTSAQLISNTLILDGLPYSFVGDQRFRLIIKTGGTIKPGTYTSGDGEVGLQFFSPSIYPYYVNDSISAVSLNIQAVNGNIVSGTFSGKNHDNKLFTNGVFTCRVKNYVPQTDSVNKWGFCEDESYFLYNIYGGNVLNAKKTQSGNRYYLTVNGESDNGASRFKIILSSTSVIATGIYQSYDGPSQNRLDSLSFNSETKIWNGNSTYLFASRDETFCRIESMDAQSVSGTLYGKINIFINPGVYYWAYIKKGKFRASF